MSSREFAQRIATDLHAEIAASEEREFDGGEHKMRPRVDVRGRDVYVVQQLHGDATASVNDRLCRVLFFIGALKDAGAARVTACLPYLAYARKDRRTQSRDPVTTRYVARMFEAAGCDRVVVLEVHNDAAFDNAFGIPTVRLDSAKLFAKHFAARALRPNLTVISPDAGGVKRALTFRHALENESGRSVGIAMMEKTRSGGVVAGETLFGDVQGTEAIVYDDLIASGGTILRAARAARRCGAVKVHAAATHGVFSASPHGLFDPDGFDSVAITDSVPLRTEYRAYCADRLTVCSVAPLFAGLIGRLHDGVAIDDLASTG